MSATGLILVAEDNPDDALLLRRAFHDAGVGVSLFVVSDGEEAMRYMNGEGRYADRNQFPAPSLILLDLEMPRMNGFQFLAWLRQEARLHQPPVIVITSSVFSATLRTAYLLGANSFLTKPADLNELSKSVREICEFWLTPPRLSQSPSSVEQEEAA